MLCNAVLAHLLKKNEQEWTCEPPDQFSKVTITGDLLPKNYWSHITILVMRLFELFILFVRFQRF